VLHRNSVKSGGEVDLTKFPSLLYPPQQNPQLAAILPGIWFREKCPKSSYKNIQNTRIYAQITNPLREQVFRELEQPPKIVRLS
jgi:hypothetical protein